MARKFLIEADETYISRDTSVRLGKSFLSESPYLGNEYLADDLIEEFDDTVTAIYRVNTVTMAVDPITEAIAQAWIFDRDNREFGLEDEGKFPAYVRDSMAWKRWNDDVAAMAPIPRLPTPLNAGDAA